MVSISKEYYIKKNKKIIFSRLVNENILKTNTIDIKEITTTIDNNIYINKYKCTLYNNSNNFIEKYLSETVFKCIETIDYNNYNLNYKITSEIPNLYEININQKCVSINNDEVNILSDIKIVINIDKLTNKYNFINTLKIMKNTIEKYIQNKIIESYNLYLKNLLI